MRDAAPVYVLPDCAFRKRMYNLYTYMTIVNNNNDDINIINITLKLFKCND